MPNKPTLLDALEELTQLGEDLVAVNGLLTTEDQGTNLYDRMGLDADEATESMMEIVKDMHEQAKLATLTFIVARRLPTSHLPILMSGTILKHGVMLGIMYQRLLTEYMRGVGSDHDSQP